MAGQIEVQESVALKQCIDYFVRQLGDCLEEIKQQNPQDVTPCSPMQG